MTDLFDRLVALRPEVPDEAGWAESTAGLDALARVHRAGAKKPAWWQRRRIVIPTVLLGLGGAVAAGAAFAPAARTPDAQTPVVCLDHTSDGYASYGQTDLPVGASRTAIVAACNAQYAAAHHTTPTDFALCVVPPGRDQIGGAEMAVPSTVVVTSANAASVCQAAGYEPTR